MSRITLKGSSINTIGSLPNIGHKAFDFSLTNMDLSEIALKDFAGKKVILNIFPSLDTAICATSVRHFNSVASQLANTVVLCISADLPFAQKRFCSTENLANVIPLSVFRHQDFGRTYGVTIIDGPLMGLLSRAIVIIDEKSKIIYTEQVAEIADEPNYPAALAALAL